MRKYLLPQNGNFYKANLHCHTTVSDGRLTPEQMKELFKKNGYSIIAYTDHDVLVPHPELADEDFLPLNGYEMEVSEATEADRNFKKNCHMCFIALEPDNLKQVCFHRHKYIWGNAMNYYDQLQYDENEPDFEREYNHEKISKMMEIGRNNGFFVTYNHPSWSLENYNDYMGYNHMHAMEIYNNESVMTGYCDYNEKEYDDMLRGGKRIYCIAADDNHVISTSCGGFTMIKANKLEYRAITDALVKGNFYASNGPEIYNLWFEDGKIHVDCSDAIRIVLNTSSRRKDVVRMQDGGVVNSADFEVLKEDGYVRITVTDSKGNHANTNAYFTDELF